MFEVNVQQILFIYLLESGKQKICRKSRLTTLKVHKFYTPHVNTIVSIIQQEEAESGIVGGDNIRQTMDFPLDVVMTCKTVLSHKN